MNTKLRVSIMISLLALSQICSAQAKEKFSFKTEKIKLKEVFQEIQKHTNYKFSYKENLIARKNIELQTFKNDNINSILSNILKNTRLNFLIHGKNIIIIKKNNIKHYNISGFVNEHSSGESLIGANIVCMDALKGTVSNNYGFYSLKLSEGQHNIKISFIGFHDIIKEIIVNDNMRLDIRLESEQSILNEIIVNNKNKQSHIDNVDMGRQRMDVADIHSMPALLGEADVMKSLQMLPGIQSSGDASANMNVRGGTYDQNLILLDDVPVYNPTHALGFFSVFNPDAIKKVDVYKGGIPAQYGDRLSSVVDIRMKDGDMRKYKGSATIGSISSKILFEGPIKKDVASFMVSARYSYAGKAADAFALLGQSIPGIKDGLNDYREGNDISFYDLNMKLNYKLNSNNRLFFSAYTGRDQFHFRLLDEKSSMDWGNITSSLRWNHIFGDDLFANTSLIFSNFDYSYYVKDDVRDFEWSSNLQEIALKTDFDYFMNDKNKIKYGFALSYHRTNPGRISPRSETSITKAYQMDENKSLKGSVYFSHEIDISKDLSVNYGFRYSAFANVGDGIVYDYKSKDREEVIASKEYHKGDIQSFFHGIEPRFNLRYRVNNKQSIKMSYTRTKQYMHLLSASSFGLPTDVWYPVNKHIKPQVSDQLSLGYFRNIADNKWTSSVEVYYKGMSNQIDFKDHANLFLNSQVEQEILMGKGWAYGAEFLLKKEYGKLRAWFSYTWSKNERKIDGINNNKAYATNYDKRHDISIYAKYELSKKLSLASNFVFSTGGAITTAKGSFDYQGVLFNHYSERNAYRLPNYHRLDVSMVLKQKKHKNWEGEWVFAIHNIYNRHNAYSIYTKQDEQDLSTNQTYLVYMFGAVPSVSYNIKF